MQLQLKQLTPLLFFLLFLNKKKSIWISYKFKHLNGPLGIGDGVLDVIVEELDLLQTLLGRKLAWTFVAFPRRCCWWRHIRFDRIHRKYDSVVALRTMQIENILSITVGTLKFRRTIIFKIVLQKLVYF